MHDRGPAPKGMNCQRSRPLEFSALNRSGSNTSGLAHRTGSRCRALDSDRQHRASLDAVAADLDIAGCHPADHGARRAEAQRLVQHLDRVAKMLRCEFTIPDVGDLGGNAVRSLVATREPIQPCPVGGVSTVAEEPQHDSQCDGQCGCEARLLIGCRIAQQAAGVCQRKP